MPDRRQNFLEPRGREFRHVVQEFLSFNQADPNQKMGQRSIRVDNLRAFCILASILHMVLGTALIANRWLQ